MLEKGRPSLLVPVAMITGGVSVSIGGTDAALIGMMFANMKVSCAPGGRCGGYQGFPVAMIGGGVALALAGVITAIVGQTKFYDTMVARDRAAEP